MVVESNSLHQHKPTRHNHINLTFSTSDFHHHSTMASAHNSMDLAAIKKSMPKKVYEGTDMEDCDPAVLLNAQLFESIAIGAMDDIRTWVKHGAPVDSRNGTTSLSLAA